MSNLQSIISVSIKRNTTTVQSQGFGVPLFQSADPQLNPKAGREWGAERVRAYTSLDDVEADFAVGTNVHTALGTFFAQTPAPEIVKVGRRSSNLAAQTVTFTVGANPVANAQVGFTINGTEYYVTAVAGDEDATATAIAALTEVEAVTFSAVTDTVTITGSTAGETFRFGGAKGGKLEDTTSGASLGAGLISDLGECIDEDNDFYCVHLDATSAVEIEALSDHIETLKNTNPKIMVARTFDAGAADDTVTDSIADVLVASTNENTLLTYTESGDYFDCGLAGRCLPAQAGTINWAYKNLSGVSVDNLTADEELDLEAKHVTFYTSFGGVPASRYGMTSGGEWVDVIRGSHYTAARIRERVANLLLQSDKIPFTDPGIQTIRAEIEAELRAGVTSGFFSASPEPTVSVPLASEISDADKQARHLKGVTFRATIAGAVNKTQFVGELDL